jgi:hypothetical protein
MNDKIHGACAINNQGLRDSLHCTMANRFATAANSPSISEISDFLGYRGHNRLSPDTPAYQAAFSAMTLEVGEYPHMTP